MLSLLNLIQQKPPLKKRLAVSAFCLSMTFGLFFSSPIATATELPEAVQNYLKQADPSVNIRFDGVVTLSNGEIYLPVLPPKSNTATPIQAVPVSGAISLETRTYDDLLTFSNHLFLIRVVRTTSGKLALAKVDPYPIALKEGLLPKDLLLPKSLYIPSELKIILGDLPYNPTQAAVNEPTSDPFNTKPAPPESQATQAIPKRYEAPEHTSFYLTDLNRYRLVEMQLTTDENGEDGSTSPKINTKIVEKIPLKCLPRDVMNGPDNQTVWVTCLNVPEVVVIDRESNGVKTRIRLAEPIAQARMMPNTNQLAITHRSSKNITWINTKQLLATGTTALPGQGGAMTYDPITRNLYISDGANDSIYEWSSLKKMVTRTFHGLDDTSALQVIHQPNKSDYSQVLWLTSRSKNYVLAIDLSNGHPIKTFTVGGKPTDMKWSAGNDDKLFIVCGAAGEVDVINPNTFKPNGSIKLAPGTFPIQLLLASEKTGMLTLAGEARIIALDLKNITTRFDIMTPFQSHRLIQVEGLTSSPLHKL